jgi:hypothetical protein
MLKFIQRDMKMEICKVNGGKSSSKIKFLINFFFFLDTESHFGAQVGLELLILLPQLLKCQDHRHVPPCLTKLLILI